MDGESLDIQDDNLNKLKGLFPDVFTEDKIDWEKLKATFSDDINFNNERYVLNWAGKADAFKCLQIPTTATLTPQPDESINFDTTQNVFIEGENLEVLKILQKSYYGKIKCIIIDPPYNTGNDSFIYPDSFKENKADYEKRIGEKDEEGYLMKEGFFRKNSKDSGHFHSNWLSMMYPRLFLAKNLLKDDGVIFVHIDHNEVHNLRLIMNEIFGEENFLSQFVWRTDGNFDNQAKVKINHEYIIAFCKSINNFPPPPVIDFSISKESKLYNEQIRNTIVKNGVANPKSKINLPVGFPADFEKGKIEKRSNAYPYYLNDAVIENFKLVNETVIESGWSSKDLALEFIDNGLSPITDVKGQETTFVISKTGALEVIKKRKENQSHVISVLTSLGNTQSTSANLRKENIYFDFPKPILLIKYLLSMNEGNSFFTLDFFAGSGTTAQAVLELNKEDGGNRKFILIQLPELTDESSEAFKAGFKTIADISKERIRRVIKKIEKGKGENPDMFNDGKLDLGFKVFKLSPSNFKIWRSEEITEDNLSTQLDAFTNSVKNGSEKQNMLFELMLKAGYTLTDKVEEKENFYVINDGELIIVLEKINQEVIDVIIESKPKKVITLDNLFAGNDQLKTNTVLQMKDAGVEFKTV
ncbi:MAG: site-specific DNA-methyltransferase [Ginsengibacter sp.]